MSIKRHKYHNTLYAKHLARIPFEYSLSNPTFMSKRRHRYSYVIPVRVFNNTYVYRVRPIMFNGVVRSRFSYVVYKRIRYWYFSYSTLLFRSTQTENYSENRVKAYNQSNRWSKAKYSKCIRKIILNIKCNYVWYVCCLSLEKTKN